jgi:hypothetical protein
MQPGRRPLLLVATTPANRYVGPMKAIRIRVENGRISGDAPAGLPDGELEVCLVDSDDDGMTDDELVRLNDALARGFESLQAGRVRPAADVIAELRRG